MRINRILKGIATVLGLAACAGSALAQAADNWPDKPVKIILNFAPGGGIDNGVRPFTEPLHRALGQPIVLEHKGGASGAIGVEAGVRSRPDGYTFFATPGLSLAVLPHIRKLPYDPFKDMVPVSYITWYPMMLSVHPSLPVANLKEFVAYAKANPDKLSLGSSGIGSTGHLVVEALNRAAGITILHVPYRGSADALNDFLAGVVQVFADPTAAPHVKAGKARLLAVTGNARHPDYPDIPTFEETYPDANFVGWNAIFAPAGTPEPIVRKLNAALDAIAKTPEIRTTLLAVGQFPQGGTPEDLAAILRKDYDRYGKLTRELKINQD
ncbi:MAG: Bug family tripartite tricarboxylate transporter substrate binding protein [Acetobacteraceae bacterium]